MKRLTFKYICEKYLNIANEQDMLRFFNEKLCYNKFKSLSTCDEVCKHLFERTVKSDGAVQNTLLKFPNGSLGDFFDSFDFKSCREAIPDVKAKELEELDPRMIGFDPQKNQIIGDVIKTAFKHDPRDGLALCLITSLYPCDGTDKQGNTVFLRAEDDYSYCLVRLMKKYKRMLANEKFMKNHLSFSIITTLRKEAERITKRAKDDCGRFIHVSLSEQYPRINEMTLPFSYENAEKDEKVKDLTLEEVFRTDTRKNIMVKGPGGCGKTFSLIGLAESLLDDEDSNTIPVYVQLNDYKESHESLLEYVYKILFDYDGSEITPKKARKAMKKWFNEDNDEQLLLLLDGFNEVRSKTLQNELYRGVCKLAGNNDKIRFIITSRYNMKSLFGDTFSKEYSANKLSTDSIIQYINNFFAGSPDCPKILQNAMVPGSKKNDVKEFLRTPMALIMYCLVNSPNRRNNLMKKDEDDDCQTYGELMEKYIKRIKTVYDKEKKDNDVSLSDVEKFLWCAGYYMSDRGVFNIFPIELKDFIFNAGFNKLVEDFDKLKEHTFFKDVIKYEDYGYIEFIHQNYRDFFAASFLRDILINSGVDEKNKYFGNNSISQEVMTLLADILKEYRYKDGSHGSKVQYELQRANSKKLTSPAISQIIRIAAKGRDNDLSSFDFSGLELSNTSLNSIKLYKNQNIYAKMDDAVVKKFTLNALGQPGAIFSMLWVEKRFLISFSKLGFFCFDMKIRKNYQITDYPEYAVRAAIHLKSQCILTGDDSGKITLWKYRLRYDELQIAEIGSEVLRSGGAATTKVQDIVEFNGKIYVSTEGGGVWSLSVNDTLTEARRENITFKGVNSKTSPCRLAVNGKKLYCSFGNIIKKISDGDTDFFDYYDIKSGKIIDIAAVDFGRGETLLINIENTDDEGNRYSKVIAVKDQTEYPVMEKPHDGRTGFKGWNSFSEMYSNEVYLAVDIEDSPESAGLLKIFSDSDMNYHGVDYYGNHHSMSVNCAVCFKYERREYIATGSTERSVEILEAQNDGGTILYHLYGHDNGIHYIDVVDDKVIYAAHYSGEVSQWMDCGNGWRCLQVWAPHTFWVWECRYISVDGTGYIISCSYDKKLSIINEKTGEIKLITDPISRVLSFGFLSDDTILTGYNDREVKTVLHTFKIDYSTGSYTPLMESKVLGNWNYDLRSIHTIKRDKKYQLLLCANTNNERGAIFRISDEHNEPEKIREISEENKKVIIRYIDSIIFDGKEIMACGGDYSGGSVSKAFYVTILDDNDERITVYIKNTEGCSALKLVEYEGSLYFIAGNYSGHIYIYIIDFNKREASHVYTCDSLNDKILNIQYRNGKVFFSTLNGKVYSFPFKGKRSDSAVPEKIFQAISGLRCCYVDFSNIDKEYSELTGDFGEIIGYYGKV